MSELTSHLKLENLNKREKLLALDKERLRLESKIIEITNWLNQDGYPGVEKSLIDQEGFPLHGLDLPSIREARQKLICTQNDHKNLMLLIEQEMIEYFSEEKIEKKVIKNIVEDDKTNLVQVFEDDDKPKFDIKIPFCYIQQCYEKGPAYEAGFRENDMFVDIGGVTHLISNPLEKVATIVKNNINKVIKCEILRETTLLKLDLVPKEWEGNGVLGMKIGIKN